MTLAVPGNYPSSDQDNVYYSCNAIIAEIKGVLDDIVVSGLKTQLLTYQLPVFVLDKTDAPNSYTISVYPKNKPIEVFIVTNDSYGNVTADAPTEPVMDTISTGNIQDQSIQIQLDPKFHNNSKIKEGNFEHATAIETGWKPDITLLASTRWYWDENLLEEKNRFAQIIRELVANGLQSLAPEEFENYRTEYENFVNQIQGLEITLSKVVAGKNESIGMILEDLIQYAYKQSEHEEYNVKNVIGQAMYDLAKSKNKSLGVINLGIEDTLSILSSGAYGFGQDRADIRGTTGTTYRGDYADLLKKSHDLWHHFLDTIAIDTDKSFNHIVDFTKVITGNPMSEILHFTHLGETKSTFDSGGWLNSWYYQNLSIKMQGEDPDYNSLDAFITKYQTAIEDLKSIANVRVLQGNSFVVIQAVLRAIAKLSQNNIDVTKFAPGGAFGVNPDENATYFDYIQRNGVLGVSGCHPYPSKYSETPSGDTYLTVQNYSNTGFLNYIALINIFYQLINPATADERAGLAFLKKNLTTFDADHDSTIGLWKAINNGGSIWMAHRGPADQQALIQNLAHLYKKDEIVPHNQVYLLPIVDAWWVDPADRTFINYNLGPVRWTKEAWLPDIQTNYRSTEDSNPDLLLTTGKINTTKTPREYQLMGWPLEQSSNVNQGGATTVKRTVSVHYGYVDGEKRENDPNMTGAKAGSSVLEFFEPKIYNAPYFWVSMVSLFRGLVITVYEELIETIKEIDPEFEFTNSTDNPTLFMQLFGPDIHGYSLNTRVWDVISSVLEMLIQDETKLKIMVTGDGAITFTDNLDRLDRLTRQNTPPNPAKMMKSYVHFLSTIGQSRKIEIVDDIPPINFDITNLLPIEGLAVAGNQNSANAHGGASQYISDQVEPYHSTTQILRSELFSSPFKKNVSPLKIVSHNNMLLPLYRTFLDRHSIMYGHELVLDYIKTGLDEFKKFIDGFEVPPEVSSVFTSGLFGSANDLANSSRIIEQIQARKLKYFANEKGYRKKEDYTRLDLSIRNKYNNAYVYSIGIPLGSYNPNGVITLAPTYITATQVIQSPQRYTFRKNTICLGSFEGQIWFIDDNSLKTRNQLVSNINVADITNSMELRHWLLFCLELDFDEAGFISDSALVDLIRSDAVTANESGVFYGSLGGTVGDRQDSTFNISPLIFPTNMFYDICAPQEFHQVVHIAVYPEDFNINSSDLIGSIQWEIIT